MKYVNQMDKDGGIQKYNTVQYTVGYMDKIPLLLGLRSYSHILI